jgi:hypothetical protein
LGDRIESSFGDEDEMIEDERSPEFQGVDIDDLDDTDLIASPDKLERKEKINEASQVAPEQPKFSEKEVEEARKKILAAFNMVFTKPKKVEEKDDSQSQNP